MGKKLNDILDLTNPAHVIIKELNDKNEKLYGPYHEECGLYKAFCGCFKEKNKEPYKPLPEYLTIKQSLIEGLGLFTTSKVPRNLRIGITHIKDERFENGYSRTPLGGFFNHSETPNCRVVHEGDFIYLETISDLDENVEITAHYTLYNPMK